MMSGGELVIILISTLLGLLVLAGVIIGAISLAIHLSARHRYQPPPPLAQTPVIPSAPAPVPPTSGKCPQCGSTLPAGALAGLCPACLLKQGAAETATQYMPAAFADAIPISESSKTRQRPGAAPIRLAASRTL